MLSWFYTPDVGPDLRTLKQRDHALKTLLEDYEAKPQYFGTIRYDQYLAYAPGDPQVDQPNDWVIGELSNGGGYLIPEALHRRYVIHRHRIVALYLAIF